MKSFCIFGGVLLLSIIELEATSVSQLSCPKRNLTVNVDDILRLYIDGIEKTGLPNSGVYDTPDVVELPCTTKLIAIHGKNGYPNGVAHILASTNDDYLLTNSTWKCSNISQVGWQEIDFDDSAWVYAVDLGRNGNSSFKYQPSISSNAAYIWLRTWNGAVMDLNVYCRKRLAPSYCLSSPCAFGGTCIQDPNNGYECICAPGYTGQNCFSVIDYCESDPCVSGGSCLPVVNGYVCQCPVGYTDDNCDDVINNCASSPCLNAGSCLNGINYYFCKCPPEWTGVRCDILLNPCDGRVCPNGGTCLNYCGEPKCVCAPGWTGNLCITYIEPCASNPCQNGGSCQDPGNGNICICPPYFTGIYCEQIIDLCASRPCLNGGSCVFDCGVYQCLCPVGSAGQNCQTPLLLVSEFEPAFFSEISCENRNLSATVDDNMRLYIDGVEITGLPNANVWNKTDVVELPCTSSLIAIHGWNVIQAVGILASTDDDYILTNSSWKCSNVSHVGWEEIGFDDSSWISAVEVSRSSLPGISSNAEWIWHDEHISIEVYCRKKLDPNYCTTINPCTFGSTCIDEPNGGYQCICAPGYSGQNCSFAIDYCESSPCVSGGSCLAIVNGYICQCPPGYAGDNCEYVTNNCESFPCLNGGTCLNGINYYACACPPQWTGVKCDILLNPCDGRVCPNGGTCLNYCGDLKCVCAPTWTGNLCISYIEPCASNPCQNGGSCQATENGSICTCPPYFTGLYCEQIIDLCASRPCLNGGTCVFDCGVYQCFCPDGSAGQNCQTPIGACDPNPCLNGGTCNNLGGDSFTCTCPINWTGLKCESANFDESLACGTTLDWAQYNASNGFTRLCYFWAPSNDIDGRNTECRYTINGLPLYDDYTGLMKAGGNFGCLISHYYPDDLTTTSSLSCVDDYQHDISLNSYTESARIMVCIRYPYDGEPGRK